MTFSLVEFDQYYPFNISALAMKITIDGTGKSANCNLLPMLKDDGTINADFGIFKKVTSPFRVADVEQDCFCSTMLRGEAHNYGPTQGTYTRVYVICLFTASAWEHLIKFVLTSTMLISIIPLVPLVGGDRVNVIEIGVTLVLTQVALVFVLPQSDTFTTAEQLIVTNVMMLSIIMMLQ